MRAGAAIAAVVVVLVLGAFATGMIDFDMAGGDLPEVEVSGGELPEAAVTTGEISVGSETVEVEVPEINVEQAPDAEREAEAEAAADDRVEQSQN